MAKQISILGSTGSIGVSTLDVIARHPDRYEVVGLAAGRNIEVLAEQVQKFQPKKVSIASAEDKSELLERCASWSGEILIGEEGAVDVAVDTGAELVVSAIVGAAGLLPTYKSLQSGIDVALANKESLVIAGKVMTEVARQTGAKLIPIDSEHSAIFQALGDNDRQSVRRVGLTASGGPFRETPKEDFDRVTVEQALKHPNWSMGNKITIDSATMMNKGLELIEATWLFDYPPEMIEIHIHPQSIVHSMVEFVDGSMIAQMGVPDMRCAIAYALSYPERIESGVESLDLFKVKELTFFEPDFDKFTTLVLAQEAARRGESYFAVLNAANEVAVEAFLKRQIKFGDIFRLLESTFNRHQSFTVTSLEDVLRADVWAREETKSALAKLAA